jgi:hypothetical protein
MFADQSPGTLVGWLLSLVGATLVLAVLGNIAAYFLLRRRRWAHRALVILWAVAASIGVGISLSVSGGFVVWVPSVAVVVVLLTPKVRTWLASPS